MPWARGSWILKWGAGGEADARASFASIAILVRRPQATNWGLNFFIVSSATSPSPDGPEPPLDAHCKLSACLREPRSMCTKRIEADVHVGGFARQGLLFLPVRDWLGGGDEAGSGSGTIFYGFAAISAVGVGVMGRMLAK